MLQTGHGEKSQNVELELFWIELLALWKSNCQDFVADQRKNEFEAEESIFVKPNFDFPIKKMLRTSLGYNIFFGQF